MIAVTDKPLVAVSYGRRPTLDVIVKLIMREAAEHGIGVSQEEAVYVDDLFTCVVSQFRAGEPTYRLTELDLRVAHIIVETIMPDESAPEPGSAHEALGFRHLREGELYFKRVFAKNLGGKTRHPALTIVTGSSV